MAKRFTDTGKWIDPWFRKLRLKEKLFWLFILDNCNEAGFWKVDVELFSFFIGEETILEEMIKIINDGKERIKIINGRLFINEFADFQYGSFRTSKHPFHKKLVEMIDYPYSIDRVYDTLQDKDKDKDKDIKRGMQGGELPESLKTPAFEVSWAEWVKHRQEIKHKLTPLTARKQLKQFTEWGIEKAIRAIDLSIKNQWRGIFDPDNKGAQNGQRKSKADREYPQEITVPHL